jgi:ribonuclease HII
LPQGYDVSQLGENLSKKNLKQQALFGDPACRDSLFYEKGLWKRGHQYIAGVDEAGRGPLAGPVVAAAVVLPADISLPGVTDSKLLTEEQREKFFLEIIGKSLAIGVASETHKVIDSINILEASKGAMVRAVRQISLNVTHVLVDGNQRIPLAIEQTVIVKGDQRSLSISAASIVAKVVRDRIMKAMHERWPQFNFATNKGYGTQEHLRALERFGPCPIHRQSFRPVASSRT